MILRPENGRLRLMLQTDHAQIAADFAAAWGGGPFVAAKPLAPVKIAAQLHDHGWQQWEQAPQIEPTSGRPYSFLNIPQDLHVQMCAASAHLALVEHPYTGLLVSLHGTGFYRNRYGYMPQLPPNVIQPGCQEMVDQFLASGKELQTALIHDLQADEQTLWTHYRWLQAWDLLSLWLAMSDPAEQKSFPLGVMPHYPGGPEEQIRVTGAGPDTYTVKPWPFSRPSLAVEMPVRYVPDRAYSSDQEFQRFFAGAPVETVRVVLLPG